MRWVNKVLCRRLRGTSYYLDATLKTMSFRPDDEEDVISPRRWRRCYLAATMKKMLSRRDSEEHAISERLIFRTFQMPVTLHRIDRFQRFSYQIKVEEKRFNLRWESLNRSMLCKVTGIVAARSTSSSSRRDGIFFSVAPR